MPAKFTIVTSIPDCDICTVKRNPPTKAWADAFIPSWSTWGNVCKQHFASEGCELGVGQGQEFRLEEKPEHSQEERIREKLAEAMEDPASFANMSYEDFEEIFEDDDPAKYL